MRVGAPVSAVAIVAHHGRAEAAALACQAVDWLTAHGHEGWLAPDDGQALGLGALASSRPLAEADLLVCLGGDGTMLRAVGLLDGAPVPLLGVNLGLLGYLTEIDPEDIVDRIERFIAGPVAGAWTLDERLLLSVDIRRGDGEIGSWRALNEAVVEKSAAGHTVRLLVRIDGEAFTSYAVDGLIVATPTGSTAYSLSARGPIMSPRHRALLLTPVSPHMLFDRSLVLDPGETIEIEVLGHREAQVAIDGRMTSSVSPGDLIRCRPAAETARFVRFGRYRYHQILKSKFGLADR